jgi:tetratricopeptide (TPR) repeat protein
MRISRNSGSGGGSYGPFRNGVKDKEKTRDAGPRKGWIKRSADWTSSLRTLLLNVGVFILIAILICIAFGHHASVIIGDIDVGQPGGLSTAENEALHRRMTEAFRAAYRLGGDAMPEQVVNGSIADEANQIDFDIPEIGISFSKLVGYIPKLLHMDRDASVDGKLTSTDPNGYALHATLTDSNGAVTFDGTDGDLDALFLKAASQLMRSRNPYVYASALSVNERKSCYADDRDCDFPQATLVYESIYKGNATGQHPDHYREWALLADSKIREDESDFDREIELAKQAIEGWSDFSWAYYNWGVALAELGCYDGAIRAFSKMISLKSAYAAAYNARGRIYLFKAESASRDGQGNQTADRRMALHDFKAAIAANSDYTEAQVNLGKAYMLDPTERGLARVVFESVLETPDSQQASRAWQQLAVMARDDGNDAKYLDDIGAARRTMPDNAVCGSRFAHSLQESLGCMDSPRQSRPLDMSSSLMCRRHSEGLPPAGNDALTL